MNVFEIIEKKSLAKRGIKEDFETFLKREIEKGYQLKYHKSTNLYRAMDMLNLKRLDVMKDYLLTYPNVTNQDFAKMLKGESLIAYKKLFDAYKKDFVKDLREREVSYVFNAIDPEACWEQ